MKNRIFSIRNVFILITSTCLLHGLSAKASVQIPNEFWISTNATGNFYTNGVGGAGGTIDNPLDGSTQANFDRNMHEMTWFQNNITIHILAGTYNTKGSYSFAVTGNGVNIVGSGIDSTILKMVDEPSSPETFFFECCCAVSVTNVHISGMTLDGNYTSGSYNRGGIDLSGSQNTVKNIKVIHCSKYSAQNTEAWGIVLGIGNNNVIEDCEVSHYAGGTAGLSAIAMDAGIIRDNHIYLNFNGFGILPTRDVLIEGNYVENTSDAVYSDTVYTTNMIIAHNIFKNVGHAVSLNGTIRNNVTIDFNTILMTNAPTYNGMYAFGSWDSQSSFTNWTIIGNTIQNLGYCYYMFACEFFNASGIVCVYNRIDPSLTNGISNSSGIIMDNNYDLNGNYRYDINTPTLGGTVINSYGISLASSASAASALTNLGLPSNPSVIVTNGQPVSFSTNVTVNGTFSITNSGTLNWASMTVTPSNAIISVNGVNVAVLQTNGVLNAPKGISSSLNNRTGSTVIASSATSLNWTNTTSANVVVYINNLIGSVTCNGSGLFPLVNGSAVTVNLQPGDYISVTSGSGTFGARYRSF